MSNRGNTIIKGSLTYDTKVSRTVARGALTPEVDETGCSPALGWGGRGGTPSTERSLSQLLTEINER